MTHTPLTELKGIGPKTAELFRKIGVSSQEELLRCYPREYDSYEDIVDLGDVVTGEKNAVLGRLRTKPTVRRSGSGSITMVQLGDATGRLQVNWFHMPYLRNTLRTGKDYIFRGHVIEKNGRRIMEHPELFDPEAYQKLLGQMLPIYALTQGLPNRTFRRTVELALAAAAGMPETLPERMRREHGLCGIEEALRGIHFPDSRQTLLRTRRRLVFEEFLCFQLGVVQMRARRKEEENGFRMRRTEGPDRVMAQLPYALTGAQRRVWEEIRRDLEGPHLMHRLIQGDVGSGKTILAFLSMIQTCENGWQSALMAPTEVLAIQHYESLCALLRDNGLADLRPVLLKGNMTAREKREAQQAIASGGAGLVIGTHALIQDAVSFASLGLVITDEQHRFGVRQREELKGKGGMPHVLVMSATPIPRTLTMILYGDLDISELDELPARRLPVKNCVVDGRYRAAAVRFMQKELDAGHQIYVVCPMIEANEERNCEDVYTCAERIRGELGKQANIGILHGRLPASEKQETMEAFAAGKIQVLVSTTVIEVGIDVPNATVMIIENAERFGLAQLHQLRGRVGRGDAQSYCVFLRGDGKEETARRLEILNETNDGFRIAEEDLRLRGPGDLFGVRQSGEALFTIADIYRDADILREAARTAEEICEVDPSLSLEEHAVLAERVGELMKFEKNTGNNE